MKIAFLLTLLVTSASAQGQVELRQIRKTTLQFASRSERTELEQRRTTKTVRRLAGGIVTAMESGRGIVRKRLPRPKSETASDQHSLSWRVARHAEGAFWWLPGCLYEGH